MIGLIGEKLPHTRSKEIHELFLCPEYKIIEIKEDELKDFVLNTQLDGFNVTIPYKEKVIPYLDYISDEAKIIGAVNTVIKHNGKIYGYNTDCGGMINALNNSKIDIFNMNVLILGTGGTSKTAKYVASILKAKSVNIVGRKSNINYENVYGLCSETNVIVNCTPVGMFPNINEAPIDLSKFNNLKGVFDCIYNPYETELIKQAKKLNINCSNGLRMLVEQARIAEELFYNTKISEDKTDFVVSEVVKTLINN